MQVVPSRDEEELVVDVHAVLFRLDDPTESANGAAAVMRTSRRESSNLVTRVHVDSSPETVVLPPILDVILRYGNSQSVTGRSQVSLLSGVGGADVPCKRLLLLSGPKEERRRRHAPIRSHGNH